MSCPSDLEEFSVYLWSVLQGYVKTASLLKNLHGESLWPTSWLGIDSELLVRTVKTDPMIPEYVAAYKQVVSFGKQRYGVIPVDGSMKIDIDYIHGMGLSRSRRTLTVPKSNFHLAHWRGMSIARVDPQILERAWHRLRD